MALLSSGANPNERSPYDGPLHVAARFGPPEVVSALLRAGADIELEGYGGSHPLHSAALAGQKQIVSLLLAKGAKVDALDNLGRTPLVTLVSGGAGDSATLKILLASGANPNIVDGATHLYALDYSAMYGRVNEARLLVDAGADVNLRESLYGESPLHFAISGPSPFQVGPGNLEVIQFLIERGADVNSTDSTGQTPLDYADRYASRSGLLHQILVQAGAKRGSVLQQGTGHK